MAITITSATYPSAPDDYSILRITFSTEVIDQTWDLSKFAVVPTSGGNQPNIESIESSPFGTLGIPYIDLTISELTGQSGKNAYEFQVEALYITSITDTLDTPNNVYAFTGEILPFIIEQVEPLSATSLRLHFNRPMAITDELLDPTRYTITGGNVSVLSVLVTGEQTLDLTTTEQDPSESYDLSVQVTP